MWAAIVIACLLAFGLFLLWVPLDLVLQLEVREKPKFRARLIWFFGLVTREIGAKRRATAEEPVARGRAGRKRPDFRTLYRVIRVEGVLRQIGRLFRDLFRQVRLRDFKVDFTIGLDDPADTGLLFGAIGSVTPFLGPALSRNVSLQPAFGDVVTCRGYARGALRVRALRLIVPAARFVFSPPVARVAGIMVSRAWKNRR